MLFLRDSALSKIKISQKRKNIFYSGLGRSISNSCLCKTSVKPSQINDHQVKIKKPIF